MAEEKSVILCAALMHGLGNQGGAWRVRAGEASDYVSPHFYADLVRKAEDAKLHAIFLAEQMVATADTIGERPWGTVDVVAVLSFMAGLTSKIGLVGTGTTTYNQPYDLARRFASLDHLANGRAGWNSVTSAHANTAEQFGTAAHMQATERYDRADEFIDVVAALWASWESDALVGDKKNAVFADTTKIHQINHQGPNFAVRGPLPFPKSRQGRPVIFHAGSSPQGRDQASRVADVVFTAQHTVQGAKEFRDDIRSRAAAYGRDPEKIKVFPGVNAVIGRTLAEAEDKKAALDNAETIDQRLRFLSFRTGVPPETLRDYLDKPFPMDKLPPDDQLKGGTGWRKSTLDAANMETGMTVRELMARAPTPHHHIVGTADVVADAMMERIEAGAADGFTMMIDVLPEGMNDIAQLLVPELRRRGVFHEDYEHNTLRGLLGVGEPQPIVPFTAKEK